MSAMIGVATAAPCGHQHQWPEPPSAEPRWYGVDFTSCLYTLPTCWACGEEIVALDVRIGPGATPAAGARRTTT